MAFLRKNKNQESKHKVYKSSLAARLVGSLSNEATYQKSTLCRIWEKQIEHLGQGPLIRHELRKDNKVLTFGVTILHIGDFIWSEDFCGIIVGFLPTSFHNQFICILHPCRCLSQEHFGSTWQPVLSPTAVNLKKSMHVTVPSWWFQNDTTNIITCLIWQAWATKICSCFFVVMVFGSTT